MSEKSVVTTAPRSAVPRDRTILRLFIFLAIVFALMTALRPAIFLRPSNFNSMMRQFPEYGIMSIGISLAMITGGIDLAVVGTANLSAIVAAKYLIAQVPRGASPAQVLPMLGVALILALACGLACGAFSGFLIAKIKIPAILATLGTQQLFTGIAIVITEGRPQSRLPLLYSQIGNTEFLDFVPLPFVLFCAVALVVGLLLSRTRFGTQLYMIGTNAKAARFAGLNNAGILVRTYMLSGLLSSIAGLIMMARANSAKADYGASYTLQCVLIAVLGGVDPNGGFGKIGGVTIAILILQMLSSGLNMFENVSNFYRDVIWGGVLILVLVFNLAVDGKARRSEARS
jgi:simple sugar transport system permease protein